MDTQLRDRWLAHAADRIARVGMRSGAARSAIVEVLAEQGQCLVSAQDITDRLRERQVGSAASVYRALEELSTLGLLHRVESRDGVARFEIADPRAPRHYHFVDDADGSVHPFTDAGIDDAVSAAARRLGLRLSSHDVMLRGRRAR